jgi:hypothetical protein
MRKQGKREKQENSIIYGEENNDVFLLKCILVWKYGRTIKKR